MAKILLTDARAFVAAFQKAGEMDLKLHPEPLVLTAEAAIGRALARLRRVTAGMLCGAGAGGIPTDWLREAYESMEVPVPIRDSIERVLVAQGLMRLANGRAYFAGDLTTWKRLAGTPA